MNGEEEILAERGREDESIQKEEIDDDDDDNDDDEADNEEAGDNEEWDQLLLSSKLSFMGYLLVLKFFKIIINYLVIRIDP